MNSMLTIASLIAVAVASPVHRGLMASTISVPASVLEPATFIPISVGPANAGVTHNIVGPTLTGNKGSNQVNSVEIILIMNNYIQKINMPASVATPVLPSPVVIGSPALPEIIVPGPVNIVDGADAIITPSPVIIGTPEVGPVNIVDGADVIIAPTPVIIGTPEVIPSPVVILPEILN